jgi:hypothetical protein
MSPVAYCGIESSPTLKLDDLVFPLLGGEVDSIDGRLIGVSKLIVVKS